MKMMLKNVRLSFPSLFEARRFNEGDSPKFSATFILDMADNAEDITAVTEALKKVGAERWGERWNDSKFRRGVKICLRPGEEKEQFDGFGEGVKFIGSNSDGRPLVLDRRRNVITAEDNVIYAGCYVNAQIDIWAQDNKYGKRLNAQLLGVQFFRDGDGFSAGGRADIDDFDDVGDDEPAADEDDPLA